MNSWKFSKSPSFPTIRLLKGIVSSKCSFKIFYPFCILNEFSPLKASILGLKFFNALCKYLLIPSVPFVAAKKVPFGFKTRYTSEIAFDKSGTWYNMWFAIMKSNELLAKGISWISIFQIDPPHSLGKDFINQKPVNLVFQGLTGFLI